MAGLFDYLQWRGDILFSQLELNNVDMLIFSALSYIRFEDIVPCGFDSEVSLADAERSFDLLEDKTGRFRVENDIDLLKAAANTERFRNVRLTAYRSVFIPEEDTQFSAVTFVIDSNLLCAVFRGTDNTLVGWKEDFNMTFQDSVPAQRLATEYIKELYKYKKCRIITGGHSKGGNLAVYAASKSSDRIQKRIEKVYNFDGPGFTEFMLNDSGYLNIVPKIFTFVPQSSVFGMLLQREEPHTIIKSNNFSVFQHDPYSWEVIGTDFIPENDLTADAQLFDKTFHNWINGMSIEERNNFFDTLFEFLMTDDTFKPRDILKPQNLLKYFKNLKDDENIRKFITSEFSNIVQLARSVQRESADSQHN